MAWVSVHWESVALAIFPLLAARYCWDLQEHMNRYAWGFYAIFVAMFVASNSWRFVPFPDENTAEAWRLWYGDSRLLHSVLVKWCYVLGIGLAFLAGFHGKMKGATALIAATVLLASVGEVIEFSYCRLRDPWKGLEHVYRMEGGRASVCGRVAGLQWIGVWLTPVLTVLPGVAAMGYTARRKRAEARSP